MKTLGLVLIFVNLTVGGICNPDSHGEPFTYHWEIDETPEGSESVTVVNPVEVTLLDEPIQVVSHSASLYLMRKYSVYLDVGWDRGYADRLLKTFESIPQRANNLYNEIPEIDASIWRLSDRHIQNDISVEYHAGQRICHYCQRGICLCPTPVSKNRRVSAAGIFPNDFIELWFDL